MKFQVIFYLETPELPNDFEGDETETERLAQEWIKFELGVPGGMSINNPFAFDNLDIDHPVIVHRIMAVENKYPGESRHQASLRLIKETQRTYNQSNDPALEGDE